jgi:predicted RNase H-like HicB family nuclease
VKDRISPAEAKRQNYPFVVIPSAGCDGGWVVVFPDLPSSSTWVADLADLATEVPAFLSFVFDADEDAGLLSPAPSGYPEDESFSWSGTRYAEPDPDLPVRSTGEVIVG